MIGLGGGGLGGGGGAGGGGGNISALLAQERMAKAQMGTQFPQQQVGAGSPYPGQMGGNALSRLALAESQGQLAPPTMMGGR